MADIVPYDLVGKKIDLDYGVRTVIVNGKYKTEEFKEFTDVLEDLQESDVEKIRNPVIKDIHLKTKGTERGRRMFSELLDKEYNDAFEDLEDRLRRTQEQLQKSQEQHQRDQEQLRIEREKNLKAQEEIKKLRENKSVL